MPARRAALAEVHDAAVVVRGIAGLDDGLTRPGNRPGPAFDPLGAFHWDIWYVFKRDHLHDDCLLGLTVFKLSEIRLDAKLPTSCRILQHAKSDGRKRDCNK
jgi:hypothetical protein